MSLTEEEPTPARSRPRAVVTLLVGAAVLALVGCGSDKSKDGNASTEPVATAPSATTPPTDATPSGPDATTTTPENQQGGAGDEQGVRVQASLLLDNNKVVPNLVKLPAFLPIELVVVSVEGVDRKLTVDTRDGGQTTFTVPALKQKSFNLPGLPKGLHQIYIDGKPQAKLDIGAEPAP
jgi:hypothetical protein